MFTGRLERASRYLPVIYALRTLGRAIALAMSGWLVSLAAQAQTPLDTYVNEGLANNTVLQQQQVALDQALFGLKEAKALFLPSLDLNASYLSGEGGRYFSFPVGDLVNPVYRTLNQFIGQNAFPEVDNVQAYLNPNNYYDAHVRAAMPLVNTDLLHNARIQRHAARLKGYEVDIYRRSLVRDIKHAYFNVLMASSAVRSYEAALALLEHNLEVTRSLERNGKGVPAQVLRAQSEREQIVAQLQQARDQATNARHYLNFLLNKELDAPVEEGFDVAAALNDTARYTNGSDIAHREELAALRTTVGLRDEQVKLISSRWVPKLSTFVDLGYQGVDWSTDQYADYYLFGVQLDLPLFHGGRDRFRQQRAELERTSAELNERNATAQLQLGAAQAATDLHTAQAVLRSATARQTAATSYFRLVERGFAEGVNTLIEYLDARTQLTSADVQLNVARCTVLQRLADVERQTAAYPLTH